MQDQINKDPVSPIKVILVDDHSIVRRGLCILINAQPDIEVVAEAQNGQQALDLLKSGIRADLLLADISLPVLNGFELLSAIHKNGFKLKTAVLSMLDTEHDMQKAFNLGSSGYLLKTIDPNELLFAIRHIALGNTYLCSESGINMLKRYRTIKPDSLQESVSVSLSERESEILQLIAQGLTNHEMAEKLFLSKRTVEGHRQNLIEKTGSRNTATLIRFAACSGLLS